MCSLSQKEIKANNENITEEEKESLAKSYVKEFFYTDNHVSMFTYGDKEIVFYKNYECISDLSLEIPKVDLGECYFKVQERYGINDSLIIGIIGQKKQGANYPVITSFSVYSPLFSL